MGEKGAPVVILECFSSRHCIRHSAQPSCADKLNTPISFLTVFSRFVTAGLRRQPRQQYQPQSNGYALGFHDPVFLQLTRRANALQRKRRDARPGFPAEQRLRLSVGVHHTRHDDRDNKKCFSWRHVAHLFASAVVSILDSTGFDSAASC